MQPVPAIKQQGIWHTFCGKKAIVLLLLGVLGVKAFSILFYPTLVIKTNFISYSSVVR